MHLTRAQLLFNQVAPLQYCIFVELQFFNKFTNYAKKKVIKNHTKSHKKTVHFCRGFYVHKCSSYT